MSAEPVTQLVAEALGADPAAVTADTRAGDLPAWDSMGTMNILLALEQTFGLRLAPGETAKLQSVAGIAGLLRAAGKLP